MAILTIYHAKDPVLHKKARPVQKIDGTIRKLIDDMFETMYAADGAGLAAPQVGHLLRLFVVAYEEQEYALINPELLSVSPQAGVEDEGCLSLPNYFGPVERTTAIVMKARNRKGKEVTHTIDGWLARIFLHEYDHLDGIMFTERMAPAARLHYRDPNEPREERTIG